MSDKKRVLIILNFGTDEIFNLHSYTIESRKSFMWEFGNDFLTGEDIVNTIKDGKTVSNPYCDVFEQVVVALLKEKKFKFMRTREPEIVHDMVDLHNQAGSDNFGVVQWKEDEFVDYLTLIKGFNF